MINLAFCGYEEHLTGHHGAFQHSQVGASVGDPEYIEGILSFIWWCQAALCRIQEGETLCYCSFPTPWLSNTHFQAWELLHTLPLTSTRITSLSFAGPEATDRGKLSPWNVNTENCGMLTVAIGVAMKPAPKKSSFYFRFSWPVKSLFFSMHALLGFLSLRATFDNEYIGKIRSWIIGPVLPILVRTTLFLN